MDILLRARLLEGKRHTALAHLEYPKEMVCKICNKPLGQAWEEQVQAFWTATTQFKP